MTFKQFIAKLFRIKTTIEYAPRTMGYPVAPGTQVQTNRFVIINNSDVTVYISGIQEHEIHF